MFQNPAGNGAGRASLPLWQRCGLLFLGYFAGAWLGRFLSPESGAAISYWLPGGLFVGVLLVNPTRDWPWLMLSVLPANSGFDLLHDAHPDFRVIGGFCMANVLQSGVGAWLVRRFIAERPTLVSLKEFFGLIAFAGVAGSAVGATVGALMLTKMHLVESFTGVWKTLWGGDAMAVLVLAPMVLAFGGGRTNSAGRWSGLRLAEGVLVFGGMTWFLWLVLVPGGGIGSSKIPVLVFVLWAGLRFGLRGASVTVFLLAVLVSFFTTHYEQGLLSSEAANGSHVFTLQVFVAVAAIVGLVPSVVLGERDRTLAKLRESENRFRSLTEAAFEGIFISENGRITDASDQGVKLFGYDRDELIGKEVIDLVVAAERPVVAEAIRSRREEIYGHQLQRKDGSTFYAEAQSRHVQAGGRTLRMTALRDITERKLAEQALRESEEKFSKAFRTSPDVMSITDLESGRYLEVNEAHQKIFGFTREQVIGRSPLELGILESPEQREKMLALLRATGSIRDMEIVTRNQQGESITIRHSAEIIELNGRTCVLRVSHDITDRIRAENMSNAQRQVMEMIASGAPMAQTLEVLLRAVEARSPEMLCSVLTLDEEGKCFEQWAAPSLPEEFMRSLEGRAIGPGAGSCGTAAFRKEPVIVADIASDPLWADYKQLALPHGLRACWSTPILDGQRNVLGTFAIYYRQPGMPDEQHRQLIAMTAHTAAVCLSKHRTEAEREESIAREQRARIEYTFQLIAAQEAERKRIAVELHDSLGQNLLLIKNLAQMALRDREPAQTYERVASIDHLAAQCIAETRQISRDLHPHQLDHLGLKRALESMLESVASASAVQFRWKVDDVDELFPADAAMNLYRIVQETLNNILKHSRAKTARVDLERDIHEVQLRITDDGCGFAPGRLAENKKGLGLKNIPERVRMLGGRLKMDSAPGEGTRIEVVIPINAEQA